MSAEPLTPEELEGWRYEATRWQHAGFRDKELRLIATVDSLSQELKAANEEREILLSMNEGLGADIHAAEAEIQRLRAALDELDHKMQMGWPGNGIGALHSIVTAALTEPEE